MEELTLALQGEPPSTLPKHAYCRCHADCEVEKNIAKRELHVKASRSNQLRAVSTARQYPLHSDQTNGRKGRWRAYRHANAWDLLSSRRANKDRRSTHNTPKTQGECAAGKATQQKAAPHTQAHAHNVSVAAPVSDKVEKEIREADFRGIGFV